MSLRFIYIMIVLSAVCMTACEDGEYMPEVARRAVIEGWIDDDGTPVVLFTSTINPGNGGGDISGNVIRWGKVTISDGRETVVMTGGPSKNYFPPYRYYTMDMTGEPGRTYTIRAEYEGMCVEATSVMPEPTPIEGVELSPVAGNDSLRSMVLRFKAPEDCPAYYYLTVTDLAGRERSLPGVFGAVEATVPGEMMQVPVMRPKDKTDDADYEPHFRLGERIGVELCRVERGAYDFWRTYYNMVMFGSSMFLSATGELPSNIAGGYGLWSARGVSRVSVEIR